MTDRRARKMRGNVENVTAGKMFPAVYTIMTNRV
jgi:hypothetical protein